MITPSSEMGHSEAGILQRSGLEISGRTGLAVGYFLFLVFNNNSLDIGRYLLQTKNSGLISVPVTGADVSLLTLGFVAFPGFQVSIAPLALLALLGSRKLHSC
jgi:hypothetical protein